MNVRKFSPQFCSVKNLQAYATRHNLKLREAISDLLGHGIFPEHFRRNRGLVSQKSQQKLLNLPIFIAGCGGLGGEIAAHLAQLGAGRLVLCDFDQFEESNLNRQRFCNSESLGKNKAAQTAKELAKKVPWGEFIPLELKLNADNAPEYLSTCEIVFDCLDSIPAKMMLEKAASSKNLAWVHGTVLQHEGFACLKNRAGGTLESLYGSALEESGSGAVLSHVVAGTASLMIAMFIKWLENPDYESQLVHADFSIPEMENFALPD